MSLLSRLRRNLSRRLMRSRLARNGNNHSDALNRHYVGYHRHARSSFDAGRHPFGEQAARGASELRERGYLVMPASTWLDRPAREDLAERIDAAFADPANLFPLSSGAMRLMDGNEAFPEILQGLGGAVEQLLHAYYGSYFKTYSVSIYRTIPDEAAPKASFLWHFDNAPDLQLKMMIYLDEVSADTGAFRFKDKTTSARVRSAGFWHRDDYEHARPLFDDAGSTRVVEGEPGTIILFQPGRVVHKATSPTHGHRDVAVIVLNPSKIYWREHLARNRHLLSTNAGLCMNLDRDLPENVGYRF